MPEWLPVLIGALLALLALWGTMASRRKMRLLPRLAQYGDKRLSPNAGLEELRGLSKQYACHSIMRGSVEDLPTLKTQGVFIGLVELKGSAELSRPLTSYLAGKQCVYYAWSVEEHWSRTVTESYTDANGKRGTRTRTESGWTTVAQGVEMAPFYLRDETGVVRVVPDGAKIESASVFDITCGAGDALYYAKGPSGAVSDSDHRRRFQESAIPIGSALYIVGHARERQDVVAPEIAYNRDSPMFLISTRSEKQVESGLAWQSWGLGILGLILALGGIMVHLHLRKPPDPPIGELLAGGLIYIGAWVLAWTWMAYNSLVGLRNRARQAWSLVDVELKRRSDLIPRLVACVQGYRDHESKAA